ncbi:hypothetical protein Hamer_G015672 [Homarus americanus]|uniref:Uncharacterized protein n=1 Tax=Homarus americanus TaxID=6706 RepID=A0A8J5J9Y4_HOMAM|nr:hypothetical protein Hamer_G015672 [Homarus americanus]
MENAGNIGSRRREGKKYAVEDEALDRIAKEPRKCYGADVPGNRVVQKLMASPANKYMSRNRLTVLVVTVVEDREKMPRKVNYLLSLHHEMDKFEAVYLELHTHMAARIPHGFGTGQGTNPLHDIMAVDVTAREIGYDVGNGELSLDNGSARITCCDSDYENVEKENKKVHEELVRKGINLRKGSGSMTNLFIDCPESPREELVQKEALQEVWSYLTNISLIFNHMRYFLPVNMQTQNKFAMIIVKDLKVETIVDNRVSTFVG